MKDSPAARIVFCGTQDPPERSAAGRVPEVAAIDDAIVVLPPAAAEDGPAGPSMFDEAEPLGPSLLLKVEPNRRAEDDEPPPPDFTSMEVFTAVCG